MARELDEQVGRSAPGRWTPGPYTFVAADALVLKVREGGRVVNVHALLATGVNGDGHREILGLDVTSAEDGAGWLGFFRDLTARGLTGVALVTSDAHRGLVDAIGATLPGAAWQRCRTHCDCKETTCPSDTCRRMMRYACRRRGPRSARPAIRGVAAVSERASAAIGAGDRGPTAGAWRGPGGRRGEWRQCHHGAQGRCRAGVRRGSITCRASATGGRWTTTR